MTIEQVWPEWKTEKILGRGSFGTVYKCCKETGNEKEYSAIKVISIPRDDYEATEIGSESMTKEESKNYYKDIVDDFLNEIKILESLKGAKNIVNIYDSKVVEKEDGIGWQIFIRMELLTDFNTYSSDKKFTPEDVKKFAIDICNALIVCGEKRIIHRDIKPENIFVDDEGNYKLGDFGVAKQMEKTYASTIRGALNYIAPEVIAAKKYDSRADIYSLGLVMYKLLNNNRLPFLDPNKQIVKHSERQDAYERRMRGEKIPPLQNVDENLNEIISHCCEFKAENRYRTADELKQALESRNVKDKGVGKFIKKHKLISAVALLLVVSIISGSVIVCKLKDSSLDIAYSGVVDYIYTKDDYDYCSTANGFIVASKDQQNMISNQKCADKFTIIDDTIFYTVIDDIDTFANGETQYNYIKCSCWSMNLSGSEKEKLFDYDGNGYVLCKSGDEIFYLTNNLSDKNAVFHNYLNLYKYNLKNKKNELIENNICSAKYSDGMIFYTDSRGTDLSVYLINEKRTRSLSYNEVQNIIKINEAGKILYDICNIDEKIYITCSVSEEKDYILNYDRSSDKFTSIPGTDGFVLNEEHNGTLLYENEGCYLTDGTLRKVERLDIDYFKNEDGFFPDFYFISEKAFVYTTNVDENIYEIHKFENNTDTVIYQITLEEECSIVGVGKNIVLICNSNLGENCINYTETYVGQMTIINCVAM